MATIKAKKFTFHYVSISTVIDTRFAVFLAHLHSTMYLFQHSIHIELQITNIIYIPLCIYFNNTFFILSGNNRIIYIPLCIYFNKFLDPHKRTKEFIYIPLCIYFNETADEYIRKSYRFTFHYVSISTQIFRSLISIRIIVALLSTKQTSIIFILTCSGNIWIITDKIRIVDLPVILQYYVPTVKA